MNWGLGGNLTLVIYFWCGAVEWGAKLIWWTSMIVDFGQVLPWLVKPVYAVTRSRFSLSTLIIGKIWGLFQFHHVSKQWHKVLTSDWKCGGEINLHILLMPYHLIVIISKHFKHKWSARMWSHNRITSSKLIGRMLAKLENHAEISFGHWLLHGYSLSFTFILIHIAYHSPSVKVCTVHHKYLIFTSKWTVSRDKMFQSPCRCYTMTVDGRWHPWVLPKLEQLLFPKWKTF